MMRGNRQSLPGGASVDRKAAARHLALIGRQMDWDNAARPLMDQMLAATLASDTDEVVRLNEAVKALGPRPSDDELMDGAS